MNSLASLVKRNIIIFYRTKGNILFSLLSVLILVALHFAIFRQMYTDIWEESIAGIPGLYIERLYFQWIVDSLMFSAIILLCAMSTSLITLGLMVSDRENNALSDFLVAPIRRNRLLASYLVSSFIICFAMLACLVLFFHVYFIIIYGVGFTLIQATMILLITIGTLIFANVFMLLLLSSIKRQQSLSGIGAIIGTFTGFVSGAYIPIGMFGNTIGNILSALPFVQLTMLSRNIFLYNVENVTPLTHEMLSGELARMFGFEIWIGDWYLSTGNVTLFVSGITFVLLVWLMIRFSKMKKDE